MRHITLVTFEDEPTGSLGFIQKGCEGPQIFADTNGQLLAHDILEHQNGPKAIGCCADELQAIGGIWQVRGRHGDLVQDNNWGAHRSIYESVAGDVLSTAMDLENEGQHWFPGRDRFNTRPSDYDEDFQEILDHARPMILAETRHFEDDNAGPFPIESFMDDALHLLRIGFRKAHRRFGDGYGGMELYRAIKGAVKRAATEIEMPGQEFRLSYGAGEARCEQIYDRGEW